MLLSLCVTFALLGGMFWLWKRDFVSALSWASDERWVLSGIVIPVVATLIACVGAGVLIPKWSRTLEQNLDEVGRNRIRLYAIIVGLAVALASLVALVQLTPPAEPRGVLWGTPFLLLWMVSIGGMVSFLVFRAVRQIMLGIILRRDPRTPGIRRFRATVLQAPGVSLPLPVTEEPVVGWQIEVWTVRRERQSEVIDHYETPVGGGENSRKYVGSTRQEWTVKHRDHVWLTWDSSAFVAQLADGTQLWVTESFRPIGVPFTKKLSAGDQRVPQWLAEELSAISGTRFRAHAVPFGARVEITGFVERHADGALVVRPIGAPLETERKPSEFTSRFEIESTVRTT